MRVDARAAPPATASSIPAKHFAGRYYAHRRRPTSCCATSTDPIPNGSQDAIAGVCNAAGNVMGMMPHPEHAVDALRGSADGLQAVRRRSRRWPPA